MSRSVTASAPGKLLLYGDHAVVYGQPCIVTAVDQRLWVTVRENGDDVFHLDAPDLGLRAYSKTIDDLGAKDLPKTVAFIEVLYRNFLRQHPQRRGIVVSTRSDFSSQFGFGSSSAVTVAFAKALTHLYGLNLTPQQLFELCYQAMLDVQGVGSGFDLAAAIWGGTIFYVRPASTVISLPDIQLALIVGYTGIKADTPTLIRMVENEYMQHPDRLAAIFTELGNGVQTAQQAWEKKNEALLGKIMNEQHTLLQKLQVSGVMLDTLVDAARSAGSFGAKLSGAGGGDCMIAIAPAAQRKKVEQAIATAGGQVLSVRIHADGVRRENSEGKHV